MDDQSKLERAAPQEIREHFHRWSVDELRRNCRADREPPMEDGIPRFVAGPRYNFCLLVDDICLGSLKQMDTSVLKLVRRDWEPYSEQDENEEDRSRDWEGEETNNDHEDFGWMYIEPCDYFELESELQDDGWQDYYLKPPLARFVDDFDTFSGFWRRSVSSTQLE